jgi:hypothetical protein
VIPNLLAFAVAQAAKARRFAQRANDAAQARRLLAIAPVLDGASREEAAKDDVQNVSHN